MMMIRQYDVQGRFLGIPYDWRLPRLQKVKERVWNERGALFPPKVFGWGWTINLKHPAAKWLFAGLFGLMAALALFVG